MFDDHNQQHHVTMIIVPPFHEVNNMCASVTVELQAAAPKRPSQPSLAPSSASQTTRLDHPTLRRPKKPGHSRTPSTGANDGGDDDGSCDVDRDGKMDDDHDLEMV